MILYLASTENKDLLKWMEQDVQVRIYHEPDMQIKFRKELPYMASVSHVIVDGSGIDMATWKAAVDLLQTAKEIPLLLLISDATIPDTYQKHEGYAVLNQAHKDIKEELERWVDQKEDIAHTWIAVAGLTPSAGTTAVAMHIAGYITSQKQRVAVTELGDIFPTLAAYYGWDELEPDVWNWGGTNYNHGSIDEASPYTVFDLGVMNQKVHALWNRCEIKILVADGKPYRLEELATRLKELREFPGKTILVFNFVPEAEKPILRKRYNSENVMVWFAPYQPDFFEVSGEYQELLNGYLKPLEVSKKKRIEFPKLAFHKSIHVPKGKKLACILLCILVAGVGIGFGSTAFMTKRDRRYIEVEAIPVMDFTATTRIRMLLTEEAAAEMESAAAPEQAEVTTELNGMPAGDTADTTANKDASMNLPEQTEKANMTKSEQNTTEQYTDTETTTEAAVTTEIQVPLIPSLSGYHGQIYTGSEVVTIMNQFSGQYVAMHLITRNSDGWYNYYADGSTANAVSDGIVQIDTSCSFLCQVIQVNGEDAGLEFVQQ